MIVRFGKARWSSLTPASVTFVLSSVEFREAGQPLHLRQPNVGDPRAAELEYRELGQALQIARPASSARESVRASVERLVAPRGEPIRRR